MIFAKYDISYLVYQLLYLVYFQISYYIYYAAGGWKMTDNNELIINLDGQDKNIIRIDIIRN